MTKFFELITAKLKTNATNIQRGMDISSKHCFTARVSIVAQIKSFIVSHTALYGSLLMKKSKINCASWKFEKISAIKCAFLLYFIYLFIYLFIYFLRSLIMKGHLQITISRKKNVLIVFLHMLRIRNFKKRHCKQFFAHSINNFVFYWTNYAK